MEKSNNDGLARINNPSYQLGRLNEIAVPDLYSIVNNLQEILPMGRNRDWSGIGFMEPHAPSSHRYLIHRGINHSTEWPQTPQGGRVPNNVVFSLPPPLPGPNLYPRGLRPSRGNVVVSNHLVRAFGFRQARPHKFRFAL